MDWKNYKYKRLITYCNKNFVEPNKKGGTSRRVYVLDRDKVLKVAINELGFRQNKNEYEISKKFSDICCNIYEAADDYLWIISERVQIIDCRSEKFKNITGVTFRQLQVNLEYFFYSTVSKSQKRLDELSKYQEYNFKDREILLKNCDNFFKPYHKRTIELLRKKKLRPYDVVGQWGINDNMEIKLFDYGLTQKDFNKYFHTIHKMLKSGGVLIEVRLKPEYKKFIAVPY